MAFVDSAALSYVGGLFLMWVVMQTVMMTPSALPMIITFTRMQRAAPGAPVKLLATVLFGAGYIAAWSGFALVAALVQVLLTDLGWLSPLTMKTPAGPVTGGILIIAGLYQWTPWKQACLRHCRSPFGYLATEWREGRGGPVIMGWRHGLYCIGCCWALMCLMFALGLMNLFWIVALAAYVLLEKVIPHGQRAAKIVGAGLVLWGVVLAIQLLPGQ